MVFDWTRPDYYAGSIYEMEGYWEHTPESYEPPSGDNPMKWNGPI